MTIKKSKKSSFSYHYSNIMIICDRYKESCTLYPIYTSKPLLSNTIGPHVTITTTLIEFDWLNERLTYHQVSIPFIIYTIWLFMFQSINQSQWLLPKWRLDDDNHMEPKSNWEWNNFIFTPNFQLYSKIWEECMNAFKADWIKNVN